MVPLDHPCETRNTAGYPLMPFLCYNAPGMTDTRLTRLAAALLMAWLLAAQAGLAGCGCRKDTGKYGTPAQLRQDTLRYSADARGEKCYIVAEIENAGELPVKEAWVAATLKSRRGNEAGVNYYPLKDVAPGEKRTISLTVSAHGSFSRVEMTFHETRDE